MGNDMSCETGNRAFIEKQMSNASGKDVATIQGFYNDFRNECPSGKLSPQKFTELCRKVLGSDQADTLQQKAFGQFDKHNDGNVNFRDFLMVVHLTSNGSAEDKLRTMFSLYDLDGNGVIEAREMESVLSDVCSMMNKDSYGQSEKMFQMMDKDKDGKITEQEFIQASLQDQDLVRMLSIRN